MNKNFKKIMVATLICGSVITSAIVSNAYAAGNVGDTDYIFTFPANTIGYNYTDIREKKDYTSSYMKLMSIYDGSPRYVAKVVDSARYPFSKSWYYYFSDNLYEDVFLTNYAAEDRGTPVNIRIEAKSDPVFYNAWKASGVWSPDSVGGN
ncbi:hypothetical protein [Clostridium tunisiense]|uniref:hypothetical protein n=1 Tax=Clostridium tunisiense TaxID=219748 RepID=UPI0002DBDC99|nr:hypothetical protein [Clostridium tunisiense]